MPLEKTEPYKAVLDPERVLAENQELLEIATSPLRELVSQSTWLVARCESAATDGPTNECALPALVLFRQLVELADAIEVLVGQSCAASLVPLLRSSFEVCLSLQFMTRADTERRARAWLCAFAHRQIQLAELLDPSSQSGKQYATDLNTQFPGVPPPAPPPPNEVSDWRAWLASTDMASIEAEYQRCRGAGRGNKYPEWYSLFHGPTNIELLARQVDRGGEYGFLYRAWSLYSHAGDLASSVAGTGPHRVGFKELRYPQHLKDFALFAVSNLLVAKKAMMETFRPGERLGASYKERFDPRFKQLMSVQVKLDVRVVGTGSRRGESENGREGD